MEGQGEELGPAPTPASEWRRPNGVRTPGFLALHAAARQVLAITVSSSARSAIADAHEISERLRRQLAEASQAMVICFDTLRTQVFPTLQRAFEVLARGLPPNWSDEDFDGAFELAAAGWPIVWVPGQGVVAKLVGSKTDDERRAVMIEESVQILDDVEQSLAQTGTVGEDVIVESLVQSVQAARHHLWIPCQVTATTALDALVGRETLIKPIIADLSDAYDEEQISFLEMRLALILRALPSAFSTFWASKGDAVPTQFNRHATVHAASHDQLTQQNALFALLLTTSLLRELHEYGQDDILFRDILIRAGAFRQDAGAATPGTGGSVGKRDVDDCGL